MHEQHVIHRKAAGIAMSLSVKSEHDQVAMNIEIIDMAKQLA